LRGLKKGSRHRERELNTAVLARSITKADSKQSYYTGLFMVDKPLRDDFYRAYAYFRWVDDVIDVHSKTNDERFRFIKQQRKLIDSLYNDEQPDNLTPEEDMLVELISHDKNKNSNLQSFIRNMFAIIEFDVYRKGRLVTKDELKWYSETIAKSEIDGLMYFIKNDHPYPYSENCYHAIIGAHMGHLMRDMLPDIEEGFINIPKEYINEHELDPFDPNSEPFRNWLKGRIKEARWYMDEGKRYLESLDVLRMKIVGNWYIARFEVVLDAIEREGYILRPKYREQRKLSVFLRFAKLTVAIIGRHFKCKWFSRWVKSVNERLCCEPNPSA
jgi:phytoene/squalene synthetase